MNKTFNSKLLLVLSSLVLLSACGNGDDGGVQQPAPGSLPPAVFVNNDTNNSVSAWSTDATTGALTTLAGSPFDAGAVSEDFVGDSSSIKIDEANLRLYVSNTDGSVTVYDIDSNTAELTLVAGSLFSSGGNQTFGNALYPSQLLRRSKNTIPP